MRTLQKKLARQKDKRSKRRQRTRIKLARTAARIANLRTDHAHQVSHRIVADTPADVLAFEDLNLRGMTRSARGTTEEPGRNVRAKAGLNRALLHQSLGIILRFTRYKAARAGKLVVTVPAAGTSQTCACCGHRDPGNRQGSRFYCQQCGHTAHADANAAANIRARGLAKVLTALGRSAAQPFAEATRAGTHVPAQGADEASRSRHLAA